MGLTERDIWNSVQNFSQKPIFRTLLEKHDFDTLKVGIHAIKAFLRTRTWNKIARSVGFTERNVQNFLKTFPPHLSPETTFFRSRSTILTLNKLKNLRLGYSQKMKPHCRCSSSTELSLIRTQQSQFFFPLPSQQNQRRCHMQLQSYIRAYFKQVYGFYIIMRLNLYFYYKYKINIVKLTK